MQKCHNYSGVIPETGQVSGGRVLVLQPPTMMYSSATSASAKMQQPTKQQTRSWSPMEVREFLRIVDSPPLTTSSNTCSIPAKPVKLKVPKPRRVIPEKSPSIYSFFQPIPAEVYTENMHMGSINRKRKERQENQRKIDERRKMCAIVMQLMKLIVMNYFRRFTDSQR